MLREKQLQRSTQESRGSLRQLARPHPKTTTPNMAHAVETDDRVRPDVGSRKIIEHPLDFSENILHFDSVDEPNKYRMEALRAPRSKEVKPRVSNMEYTPLEPLHIVGDAGDYPPLSEEEAIAPLGVPIIYADDDDEYYATFSVEEVAIALNVSASTIIDLITAGQIVGLDLETTDWRVPKAQIRDGVIAPGLEKIKDTFLDNGNLWQYLITEQLGETGWVRPLDIHFQNNIELALQMADHLGTDYT